MNKVLTRTLFLVAIVLGLLAAWGCGPQGNIDVPEAVDQALPVVGSADSLKKLLRRMTGDRYLDLKGVAVEDARESAPAAGRSTAGDYSTTNIQVAGVDEADIIKTDGEYIFQVNNRRILAVRAYPAEEMEVAGIIEFEDKDFYPQEIYLDEKYLIVVGGVYPAYPEGPGVEDYRRAITPELYNPTVKAMIYDVADKTDLRLCREIELTGSYLSSRKVGQDFYLVANQFLDTYRILEEKAVDDLRPSYRDTAGGDNFNKIDFDQIRYFPELTCPNYLLVAGISLDDLQLNVKVNTYLGAGENIYASAEHLYVALTSWQNAPGVEAEEADSPDTAVYKFSLDGGKVSYLAEAKVPGVLLNQFSMDEYQGYFRLATTSGQPWFPAEENSSRNNIYILDKSLNMAGRLEGLAPGERIYAARFMGDRGYLVTFRTVDPLFVLDLTDPGRPVVLGELKIPGYSNYLHPYDEHHLLGFGQETFEVPDDQGGATGSFVLAGGMKVALFEVSNPRRPVQKFTLTIGDRGTYSELLWNHKALLFSREKELLAFPVTVMKAGDVLEGEEILSWGELVFQGAYIYQLNLTAGFNLRGTVTHLSAGEDIYNNPEPEGGDRQIQRIIYIGDTLYTVSQGRFMAHDWPGLEELGLLEIPQ
ncbi:MAG TPA: hypothetical protein GX693_04705 [Firmicutes bacterium]|nr:hypothetical protein [Bacillota bacterium]